MNIDLITPEELAQAFKVSRATVMIWARSGVVPVVRINAHTIRFHRADVMKLLRTEVCA